MLKTSASLSDLCLFFVSSGIREWMQISKGDHCSISKSFHPLPARDVALPPPKGQAGVPQGTQEAVEEVLSTSAHPKLPPWVLMTPEMPACACQEAEQVLLLVFTSPFRSMNQYEALSTTVLNCLGFANLKGKRRYDIPRYM